MALPLDRRSVLSTLAGLPLAGCSAAPSAAAGETVQAPSAIEAIDLHELKGRGGGRLGLAHKIGAGGYGPTNDIGVLYPPTGEPVVLALYYHATSETSAAANDTVIAEATRSALKAVGHG